MKQHLAARDDEIRVILASTEWKELLVPFSRFVHDTSISVRGVHLKILKSTNEIKAVEVAALEVTAGRVLSPWHEVSFYRSESRLREGIASYDFSCQVKGIDDYIMVILSAPEGHYERGVLATANAVAGIRGDRRASDADLAEMLKKLPRLDYILYFVPQIFAESVYLDAIMGDPDVYEEAKECLEGLSGEEALCTLQEFTLFAKPNVERDGYEIGYPAKFKSKLVDGEGWEVREVLRRGAFLRNAILTDDTILGEIAGDAGASGQRFKRTVVLSDKAALSSAKSNIKECLINNPAWTSQIVAQLDEASVEFPSGQAEVSVFSPSTGVFTIFFSTMRDDGILYIPSYSVNIIEGGVLRRVYFGELTEVTDDILSEFAFGNVIKKYYDNDIGMLVMRITNGGYEHRDADILYDLNLDYASFRCDLDGDQRAFFRSANCRWRSVTQINMYQAYYSYLEKNERLVSIVCGKLEPRIGPVMSEGSCASRHLEQMVDSKLTERKIYYNNPPEACDICRCPLTLEPYMSDAQLRKSRAWANFCADCTMFHASGIGWGVGQLYRNEGSAGWLLVAGGDPSE